MRMTIDFTCPEYTNVKEMHPMILTLDQARVDIQNHVSSIRECSPASIRVAIYACESLECSIQNNLHQVPSDDVCNAALILKRMREIIAALKEEARSKGYTCFEL